ncbi:hypothetical protein LIA77_10948 [Sarocladium implicatum]|nr:hypothetical protein LIA77_10948 [Sarocladium implicatum]
MKFSSVTAAGAVFGLAAATPIHKRSSIQKRQVPQEQSHGFILDIANEFMKLENTKNIQDAVFGLLGNAAAEEGAGDVTNLDCLKQETADQAFTNAKAAGDIRGMAGALLFQAIERNTGSVGLASVLCDEPTVNPEIGAITSHQDAASDNALAINKAITLEAARQLAAFGADPNLALLSGTFAPGDPNDNTGAGFTCDDVDLELGCIYTEGLLVLDATEDEIASAVADVEQTFTGTGGIFATDLVNLADFDVADVQDEFNLSEIAPGSGGAVATPDAGATPEAGAGAGETPAVTDECSAIVTTSIAPSSTPAAGADVTGECSLVTLTVGADQTSAVMAQYPSAVLGDVETPTESTAAATATATEAAEDNQGDNQDDNQNDNQDDNQNDNQGDNQNDNQGDNQGDNAAGAGNLQTFAGSLGGAAPQVVNNGDANRPFEVNGAAFDNERSALIRSCDIQNNQCFNAVNGGELAGGTAQCADQLAECQASAGGAPQKRETKRSRILGGVSSKLLGGAGGGAAAGGSLGQLLGGGGAAGGLGQLVGGGAQSINLGTLLGGGNISKLIGGSGLGAVLPASSGSQSLVSVVIQQCN